jgi:NAD(P)H-hydrate repair Nnr-like enzyme with NAD(P)H-hydrate epimerase domain
MANRWLPLLALLALGRLGGNSAADPLTVGLFAPTAPFPSTAARVELASHLGEDVGKVLGVPAAGKVFARAGDFAAAVRKGEVTVALVDATYLAVAGGSYTVLAAGTHAGDTTHVWQLVARGPTKISELRGKRVLVPAIGGRETDFVVDALLGGEVRRDFFAKIESAPDTASALAALGLGKTDAAIVPAGIELPAGASVVLKLPSLSGPVLVAYGTLPVAQRNSLAASATTFRGDATITSFKAADADAVRAVARRFTPPAKRGPLAVPAIRLLVGDLVEGRTLAIERTPAATFAVVK